MSGDAALEQLKLAVVRLLSDRTDVVVSGSRIGDGSKECLVLTVEPAAAPCRYLRIHTSELAQPEWRYAWLWSSYRAADGRDNGDGRNLGDLRRMLDMIQHWIVEGMRRQDVPELAKP